MKQLIPVREFASRTGCSEDTVRRLIRSGRLSAINTSSGTKPNYRIDAERAMTELSADAPPKK